MQKFVLNLWYDDQAEAAAKLYVSLFKNSKIINVSHYGESAAKIAGKKVGDVLTVDFELDGQQFTGINGGPLFKLTEAASILVNCKDQAEIDRLWDALAKDGGEESQCGWLKDKYGLSWQIVPEMFNKLMAGPPKKIEAAMAAMLKMQKLDIAELQRAYDAA